ncbi:hypothetical protein ABPG73_004930 [Tetrahymena malaccensis]
MLQFYILFITVFYLIGYPVLEMIYCIPIIAFLQLLQYLCFWKPKDNCFPCFLICNTCFFVISFALFVGIFLGIFNQTLQYHFQEVQECKVIGKFSTFLLEFPYYSSEKYSALYVDFQMDGQQFLGYGCLSSSTEETNPTGMFAHNPLIFQYYGQQQSYDSYKSLPYEFSQVKLPSWMCIPFDTDYEELVKTKNCYVHFFNSGKGQTKDQAFLNSKNRLNVRDLQSFALISFKELNAPFNQKLKNLEDMVNYSSSSSGTYYFEGDQSNSFSSDRSYETSHYNQIFQKYLNEKVIQILYIYNFKAQIDL